MKGHRMKKKLSWHFYLVCVFIAIIVMVLCVYFNQKLENAYEMTDLQTMRSAEAAAALLWRDNLPQNPVEYWFDADSLELIPASEPRPEAYGAGTGRVGHALKNIDDKYTSLAGYSESADYTDKILKVVVSSKDDDLDIDMEWVSNE